MEGGSVGGITTVNTTLPNVASDNYDLQCNDGPLRQEVVSAGANSDLLHGQRTRQGRQEVVPGWDENYFVLHWLIFSQQGGPRGRSGLTEPLLICDLPGQNIATNPSLRGENQVYTLYIVHLSYKHGYHGRGHTAV